MAKLGRKKRNAFDAYETPRWMLDALTASIPFAAYSSGIDDMLEPCVGDGAISNYFAERALSVSTNDIDPKREADFHRDARDVNLYRDCQPDLICTNPPFIGASAILRAALEYGQAHIALLLRVSFEEPTHDRRQLLKDNPPDFKLNLPRYSFDGEGQDSNHCAWYVWYNYAFGHVPDEWPRGIDFYLGPHTKKAIPGGRAQRQEEAIAGKLAF